MLLSKQFAYLISNLSKRAMKIPGMTMSPRPNIAKLLAARPFTSKSWGNTTIRKSVREYIPIPVYIVGINVVV